MLHTSWFKVAIFFGAWATLWLPIAFRVAKFIGWQPNVTPTPKQKLILLASLYVLVPIVIGWKTRLELLSFAELGLSPLSDIIPYLVVGLSLSLTSTIALFSWQYACNLVSWQGQNVGRLLPLFIPLLCLSLLISFAEELVFRGYVFYTLSTDSTVIIAAIASSLVFALLHLIWEREQTLPQIPGLWLMGMVLVAARIIADDSIYLAIGLHAGWIYSLTCIDSAELITYNYQNHWITGINRQPLAGIAGIVCLAVTGLAMWIGTSHNLLRFYSSFPLNGLRFYLLKS